VSQSHTVNSRWNAIVSDFRRSGLTQANFCRQRNISLASFRYHFYKPLSPKPTPSDARSSASPDHHFLPVTILPDPILSSTASQPHFELILSNGRRIAVAPGFDTQTLRRLIAVVEERPCSD
jgi:hypothetical protein